MSTDRALSVMLVELSVPREYINQRIFVGFSGEVLCWISQWSCTAQWLQTVKKDFYASFKSDMQ